MDLDMGNYVRLGGTAKKDSVIKEQHKMSFSEDAYDFSDGKLIGGPVDIKGGKEEGE